MFRSLTVTLLLWVLLVALRHPSSQTLAPTRPGDGPAPDTPSDRALVPALKACVKWRYDLGNTGWNPVEIFLSPGMVNAAHFGKLWEHPVDGQLYAQPLYVSGVNVPGHGQRNLVFAATEHNTVYAFDALRGTPPYDQPVWQVSLGPSVSSDIVGCGDLTPEYGITSTPVIDLPSRTMFVMAKHLENGQQVWRLHALDIATGSPRAGWGIALTGSVPDSTGAQVVFRPDLQFSRSALTIHQNRLYAAFGSHCDNGINEYHGWVFSYDIRKPGRPPLIWNATPDSSGTLDFAAGIWMSGASPAFDERGKMYVITGNGQFDVDQGGTNRGNSFVKLSATPTRIAFSGRPTDYFTPSNQDQLRAGDTDLGSGGPVVIPTDGNQKLLVGGGKDAILRVLDCSNMGGFTGRTDPATPDHALQDVPGFGGGFWSSPAYCSLGDKRYLYANGVNDVLRQFAIRPAGRNPLGSAEIAESADSTGYPSSTPVVSSYGIHIGTGVVWLLNRNTGALHAYDATDVSHELYNSNQNPDRDALEGVVKFSVPLVANSRVYVGTYSKLTSFGILPRN